MNPDGSDRRCLVDTAGVDISPAWSPDGRWVAFVGGTAEEQRDVYVVRADGTKLRQLTSNDDVESDLVWSPDGTRIGYTSETAIDGPSTIHVMSSRHGTGDTIVLGDSPTTEGHPELQDWTPDPDRLLFRGTHGRLAGLWTVDVDGSHFHFLGGGVPEYGNGAVYSPDGRSLAFEAELDGGCIYKSDADDAAVDRVIRLTEGCTGGDILTWSPDSRWIAWAGGEKGPTDAQVMTADGRQLRTIADDSDVAYMAWQPAT
jgi:Tol biopolymer transport system component